MNKIIISLLIFSVSAAGMAYAQTNDYSNRLLLGEKYARQLLESTLHGTGFNLVNKYTIVPDREVAIQIAEVVLFKIYGQETIINDRPYEVHLIADYWILFGTVPEKWRSGVFKIIISSKSGQVMYIGHDK